MTEINHMINRRVWNYDLWSFAFESPFIVFCHNTTVMILILPSRFWSRCSPKVVDYVRPARHGILHVDDDLCHRGDEKKKNHNLLKRYISLLLPFLRQCASSFPRINFFLFIPALPLFFYFLFKFFFFFLQIMLTFNLFVSIFLFQFFFCFSFHSYSSLASPFSSTNFSI